MTLIVRPGFQFDTDASTYIEAVEVADAQALETATRYAINDFVIGCKQDGIWSAIKASCILAGARTLAGALIPLAGTAPTNNNFVSGDYNRKTGLVGNGSSKYLNSNRNDNVDPLNNRHVAVFKSAGSTNEGSFIDATTVAFNNMTTIDWNNAGFFRIAAASTLTSRTFANTTSGFFGVSRSIADSFISRISASNFSHSVTSTTVSNNNYFVFNRPASANYSNARLAFYSIGESLNLAALDARVTALITAFGVAIP